MNPDPARDPGASLNDAELDRILADGADRIRPIAADTLARVYDRVGILARG